MNINELINTFRNVKDQAGLSELVRKFRLAEVPCDNGQAKSFTGTVSGIVVTIVDRTWDPSSVYAVQPDRHEVILRIPDLADNRIKFSES